MEGVVVARENEAALLDVSFGSFSFNVYPLTPCLMAGLLGG